MTEKPLNGMHHRTLKQPLTQKRITAGLEKSATYTWGRKSANRVYGWVGGEIIDQIAKSSARPIAVKTNVTAGGSTTVATVATVHVSANLIFI